MRIQCNLLSFFLLGLVVTISIAEASGGKRHKKKKGKKVKRKGNHYPPSSILLDDSAAAEHEVLVPQVSTGQSGREKHEDNGSVPKTSDLSSLQVSTTSDLSFLNLSLGTGSVFPLPIQESESPKRNDGKRNMDDIHSSSSPFSSSLSSASERNVKQDVIKAFGEDRFASIKENWGKWQYRKDLFDYVVTNSADSIARFINQVVYAKRFTLAALFVKRLDIVDDVLKKINYDDDDLVQL